MTGPAVGIQTVWGCGVESAYGTAVTVDRFYEILTDTIKRQNRVITSNGLRGGTRNLRRGSRRVLAANDAVGNVTMEVATTGFGRLLQQILGVAPVITGAGDPYTQTYSLGSVQGRSLTTQKQLVDSAGNHIETLTRKGCKIMSAEFAIRTPTSSGASAGGILEVTLTFDCQNENDTTSAASASYTSTALFGFAGASLSIAGSPVANVLDATLKITNNEDVNRYFLGSSGQKAEPADSDYPTIDGQMTAEILDASYYTLYKPDTAAALSLAFANGTHSLTFNVPEIHVTDVPMDAAGVGVIRSPVKYEGAYDGTDPGITAVYVTSDAAA